MYSGCKNTNWGMTVISRIREDFLKEMASKFRDDSFALPWKVGLKELWKAGRTLDTMILKHNEYGVCEGLQVAATCRTAKYRIRNSNSGRCF